MKLNHRELDDVRLDASELHDAARIDWRKLGFESYQEWLDHHPTYRDFGRHSSDYHEQMVRY